MTNARIAKAILIGLFLTAILVTLGCSAKPNDGQIAQDVQTAIRKDSAIVGEVNVESAQGVVTLNGHVENDTMRLVASRDAAAVPGVKQIVNDLTVVPPAPEESAVAPPPAQPKQPARSRRPPAPVQRAQVAAARPLPEPAPAAPPPAPVAAEPVAPPPPPAPTKYTIPAGTVLSVRLIDALDSSQNKVGETFRGSLNSPVRSEGEVVLPAGLDVEGRIVEASNQGRYSGHSELRLELTKLIAHGETYAVQTEEYGRATGGRGKGTAETIGAGAGIGAVIGGIAGGGKGAAIGAITGAGAGGVARAATRRQKISFPSETVLNFTLREPLTVPVVKSSDRSRRQPDWGEDRSY